MDSIELKDIKDCLAHSNGSQTMYEGMFLKPILADYHNADRLEFEKHKDRLDQLALDLHEFFLSLIDNEKENEKNIKNIGIEADGIFGLLAMQYLLYVVNWTMQFVTKNPDDTDAKDFYNIVSMLWDGVGEWRL